MKDGIGIMKLLTNPEAAEFLGVGARTLDNSRTSGILLGQKAPQYIKYGRFVRYEQKTLIEWQEQFQKCHSTAEYDVHTPDNAA